MKQSSRHASSVFPTRKNSGCSPTSEWDLAKHVAESFFRALRLMQSSEGDGRPFFGLESPVLNDVLVAKPWKLERVWNWRRKSHINVLEANPGVAMLEIVARRHVDARFVGQGKINSKVIAACLPARDLESFSLLLDVTLVGTSLPPDTIRLTIQPV